LPYYFGNDYFKIQPALYYRQYNIEHGSIDLSVDQLLTTEFKHKIQHLVSNLYNILSESYNNGDSVSAQFHIEKSTGLGEGSRIDKSLYTQYRNKYNDLIQKNLHSLHFIMDKQGDLIVNEYEFRSFVVSIALYLVFFNAIVLVGDKNSGFSLFASQRKIYNDDYMIGLYVNNLPVSTRLNQKGQQIFTSWRDQWNQENEQNVWNFEDCWPIFMLPDARTLIRYFETRYRVDIKKFSGYL
jgi:hypothetical protein